MWAIHLDLFAASLEKVGYGLPMMTHHYPEE
jgi:hypothetical protein